MAMTPASVGVNQPVRMPPNRMTGITSGNAAAFTASPSWANDERGRR